LFQDDAEGIRRPIGYWSRQLIPAEVNYSPTEKECLALVWGIQVLRPYLLWDEFDAHTDHYALRWLMTIKDPSGRLMRWRLRLSEFRFIPKYKKGMNNAIADMASRSDEEDLDQDISLEARDAHIDDIIALGEEELNVPTQISLEEITRAQEDDAFCLKVRYRIEIGEDIPFKDSETSGALTRTVNETPQIVIPKKLQPRFLSLAHRSLTQGHVGGRKMYRSMRRQHYFPGMVVACYNVVRDCTTCAKERVRIRKTTHFLKLFPATEPL